MSIEFNETELTLLDVLLQKELGDTRVEIHHSKNHEYKAFLVDREKLVNELIGKIGKKT